MLIHYTKSQLNKIDSAYSENHELKQIKERIKSFYSILIHDRTTILEEKVKKWQNSLDHFIGTENWTKKENELTIQILKQIIQKFVKNFF